MHFHHPGCTEWFYAPLTSEVMDSYPPQPTVSVRCFQVLTVLILTDFPHYWLLSGNTDLFTPRM